MGKEYKRYQEGLIRSILARPEEIVNVVDYIDSGDFEDVNFKMVYESVLELYLEKKSISLPEITLKIGEGGGAVDTGWLFNLSRNMVQWIQVAPPTTWAKLLKRESAKTKAENVLKAGLVEINKKENNPLSIMDKIATSLSQVSVDATAGEMFNINDVIDEFEAETKEILSTGGNVTSINSAYPTIDYYTQGWGATHLITVGARTGVGKSVFAINNAVAAMSQEKTVLFFSLEMTRREVLSRIIASLSMIPIQKIEKAHPLTDDEKERQKEALSFIRNSKLKIDTNPHVTVEYIKRAAIKQAQSDDGLDLIIIDYLQLIANDGIRNRQEAVADVSRNMKILAKELNVPVIVLVQLNRERRDDDGDSTPKIYDIRESGAIAQDSNVVILIDRNMNEDTEVIDPKATFIIAKNRQGESNKYISVRTRLESSLFIDDNKKGQKVLDNIEQAIEDGGDYEINIKPTSHQNSYDDFNDIDVNDEDLENLFSDEEGFGDEIEF
ncbi:MAG TPA: AAA family ATPase [Clostridiales bacterium]|nr:AAA family ATPase [Clostridiales bacterium]